MTAVSNLTIAAAQSSSQRGAVQENVQAHMQFVRVASEFKTNLIVFPELSLTGYEPEIAQYNTVALDDARLAPLKEQADRLNMTIVVGAPVASSCEKPYIGALIVSPGDTSVYAKRFLHAGEEEFFTPGSQDRVIDVNGVTVGIAICADITHPVHAEDVAARGASIYAAGVLLTDRGYTSDAVFLRQYAEQHRMTVLMANYASPTGGFVSGGRSAAWDSSGRLAAVAGNSGEALVIVTNDHGGCTGKTVRL